MSRKVGWIEKHATAIITFNLAEVVQNKSSLLPKIILWNTQTLQLFKKILNLKLFTKDTKNGEQQGLHLGDLTILTIKGVEQTGLEVRRGLLNKIRKYFMRAYMFNQS